MTHVEYPHMTVAWVIQAYIEAMNGCEGSRPVKPLGASHLYTLQALQRAHIGTLDARKLTDDDIIDHAKARIKTVAPSTVNQDIGYLDGALKYVRADRRDCRDIVIQAVMGARPYLVKNGYISKSIPRSRTPTDDEIERLLAYFSQPPKIQAENHIYAMPDIIAFALASSRRRGEICRITHSDIDWNHAVDGKPAPMYTVRKMKHPTKKDHTKRFPLFPELAEIVLRQPRKAGDDRIFPFNAKSVGAKYTAAKHALGIENLRFHDSRRQAITNWLKKMTPHQVRHFVSGHDSVKMIESNYDATDPAGGHALIQQVELRP